MPPPPVAGPATDGSISTVKRILILGIGSAQVDALRWCRTAGFEVHACGMSEQGAGRSLVERFLKADIRDGDAVEQYARENRIDVVYSVGSDVAMPTVALVSERLGLPCFFPHESAATCGNKVLMRRALGPDFAGNVAHRLARSLEEAEAWDTFPCVMKPVDNQGQRGVFTIRERSEMREFFRRSLQFSPGGGVILEEYADGSEVSANTYVVDGKVRFTEVTDRAVFEDYPGGIVREHRIPSSASAAEQQAVRDLVGRVLDRIRVPNGPVYFQAKLTDRGPVLLEMTPRLDGCHLWRLIREYCSVDLLECTFRHLLGDPLPSLEETTPGRPLVLRFPSAAPGTEVDHESLKPGRSLFLEWYYGQGEKVRPINGYMEKVGYLIAEPEGTGG